MDILKYIIVSFWTDNCSMHHVQKSKLNSTLSDNFKSCTLPRLECAEGLYLKSRDFVLIIRTINSEYKVKKIEGFSWG